MQTLHSEGRYSVSKVLAGVYVAAVLALAVTAVLIWRLRCESFGCIGIGVAWFAWVVVFFPTLGLGAALRSRSSLGTEASQSHTLGRVEPGGSWHHASSSLGEQECSLTLPSRGRHPASRAPPLMSNVERHEEKHRAAIEGLGICAAPNGRRLAKSCHRRAFVHRWAPGGAVRALPPFCALVHESAFRVRASSMHF